MGVAGGYENAVISLLATEEHGKIKPENLFVTEVRQDAGEVRTASFATDAVRKLTGILQLIGSCQVGEATLAREIGEESGSVVNCVLSPPPF